MSVNLYLSLDEKSFEKTKQAAKQRYKENTGESNGLEYPDIDMTIDEQSFENGQLDVSGEMIDKNSGINLGYISVKIDMDLELAIDVIEFYMKKLGKLKTVLEATK